MDKNFRSIRLNKYAEKHELLNIMKNLQKSYPRYWYENGIQVSVGVLSHEQQRATLLVIKRNVTRKIKTCSELWQILL